MPVPLLSNFHSSKTYGIDTGYSSSCQLVQPGTLTVHSE